jgi:hypothetical protein
MAVNFAYEISLFIYTGFFNMPPNLMTWEQRLYFPSEAVLQISIVLKNPSSSAGFEPVNLEFNGKHANH